MSVRYSRPLGGRPGLKKATSGRKKVPARQAWDSSVQDLNIHRATPEELARRHEIHKSKNQRLAHWELQRKSFKKKWREENGGTPDPLEGKRLALMMEILSDQYQMTDVLERSDRAMAVVKDLFGDAPHRHTGFPNVTMAPSCDLETSRGPVVQRKDPPTRLSILSESVMDSQALNDVDESPSEYSDDDDVEVSISFQPGLNTDRIHRLLNEERSRPASQQQSNGKTADVENLFVTPKSSGCPTNGHSALNATEAVKKVKTRLTPEELEEPKEPTCVIGQVLNPNPPNHQGPHKKGRKKRWAHPTPSSDPSGCALPSCNQSSLDVLNHMIQDVERELEEYERQTGRQVQAPPRAQGLTGFTLSLVCSIRRLVTYLKEGDLLLRQEVGERQRLEAELHEQRLLIDALTAEVLSMKEDVSFPPLSRQSVCKPPPTAQISGSPPSSQPEPRKSSVPTQALRVMADLRLQDVEREVKQAAPPCGRPEERAVDVGSLGFQPAVLLSPPRQRTREEFELQNSEKYSGATCFLDTIEECVGLIIFVVRKLLGRSLDAPSHVAPASYTEAKDSHSSRGSRSSEQRLQSPACRGSNTKNSASICSSQSRLPSPRGDLDGDEHQAELQSLTEDGGGSASVSNESIVGRMAELALQNNALKAQLREFGHKTATEPADSRGLHTRTEVKQNASSARTPMTPEQRMGMASASPARAPMTLEQRIAELNRQSAEARDKLLRLIELQKQSTNISPAISPITPQGEDTGRRGHIEAVIPMPSFTDSSIEETPSPGTRSSGRRSSASNTSVSTVSSSFRGLARAMVGKQKEEGWFALTAHVS
ncbi:spindle and centriole-associated protein 1 [Gastrophryne carolinensis]